MPSKYNYLFMNQPRGYFWPAVCLLAPGIALVAIHPILNMGFNDEQAYAWMSRAVSETGGYSYGNYIGPMTGPLAY